MEPEGSSALPLKEAYLFGEEHGLGPDVQSIRDMEIEWDQSYTSSLRRGFIVELFQQKGVLPAFLEECWPNGRTRDGENKARRYLRILADYRAYLNGTESDGTDDDEVSEQAFAAEADLRDFLAANLTVIEPGLRLYEQAERKGVEFPVDQGRIDILAIDAKGTYVVIELKLSCGRAKALGQLLYYMGWVDREKGKGHCRGIIVAREISNELLTAARRVPGLTLFQYDLKVSLKKVE